MEMYLFGVRIMYLFGGRGGGGAGGLHCAVQVWADMLVALLYVQAHANCRRILIMIHFGCFPLYRCFDVDVYQVTRNATCYHGPNTI